MKNKTHLMIWILSLALGLSAILPYDHDWNSSTWSIVIRSFMSVAVLTILKADWPPEFVLTGSVRLSPTAAHTKQREGKWNSEGRSSVLNMNNTMEKKTILVWLARLFQMPSAS